MTQVDLSKTRVGQLVHAKVFRITRELVMCRLDNGLFGSIKLYDLTDAHVSSPDEVVTVGKLFIGYP